MPGVIDPQSLYVSQLPTIWSPVQWELTEEERIHEVEEQAKASLMWMADVPESILRLLLSETDIERAYEPPAGYDPEVQGEWDPKLVTYQFKRPLQVTRVQHEPDYLYVELDFGNRGRWALEVEPEKITFERI